MTKEQKTTYQFWVAVALMIFGCVMLMMGFWTSPLGEISNSVLVAFGEISTLAASILGIDAVYDHKLQRLISNQNNEKEKETK